MKLTQTRSPGMTEQNLLLAALAIKEGKCSAQQLAEIMSGYSWVEEDNPNRKPS